MLHNIPFWNLFLALLILQGQSFSLPRIWEANLFQPSDIFPMGRPLPEDQSRIPYPDGNWKVQYAGSLAWMGWLKSESRSFSEVASRNSEQALWVRPTAHLDFAFTGFDRMERNRYLDSGKIEGRLGESRQKVGITVVEHMLPGAIGEPYIDLAVQIPDIDRQNFAWMFAGGRRGLWHAEYSLAHAEVMEEFNVLNLDPTGGGEKIQGLYNERTRAHRILIKAPLLGGKVSSLAAYSESEPRRPTGEFWFSDSSQRVDGSLSYTHPWYWGNWKASAVYRESEAFTFGRRIPPGSDGLKRFHYARNHAQSWQIGGENIWNKYGLSTGISYRDYGWKSTPSQDALDSRNETLSYNRLGLSFIANLYGGFFKAAELIAADFIANAWVADMEWRSVMPTRLGNFESRLGLSSFRSEFKFDVNGHTLSQRFISIDTSAVYGPHIQGSIIGVTPELSLQWGKGRMRLEAGVAQIIPLVVSIERSGKSTSQTSQSATNYPIFHNGFSCHLNLEAGY